MQVCADGDQCSDTLPFSIGYYSSQLGIKYSSSGDQNAWSDTHKWWVIAAAISVGNRLGGVTNKDAISAFRNAYGIHPNKPFVMEMGSCGPRDGRGGCGDPAVGAYTWGSRDVEFSVTAPFYPVGPNRPATIAAIMSIHQIVHEFGHAFAASQTSYTDNPYAEIALQKDLLTSSGYQVSDYPGMWTPNSSTAYYESFANTFLGWVYGEFANDRYGTKRLEFMEDGMPRWLNR